MNNHLSNSIKLAALAALAFAAASSAGPLDPPPGPVTSTLKTLREVEPAIALNQVNTPGDNDGTPSLYKITQPGSYYLTGNVDVPAGKTGIEILASGVTIDLRGFRLSGGTVATYGILSTHPTGLSSCVIRNGEIRYFAADGVNLALWQVYGGEIDRVRFYSNGDDGCAVGPGFRISDCSARGNTDSGFETGPGAILTDCVVDSNDGAFGCIVGERSSLRGCTAERNTGTGFSAGDGSTLTSCTVSDNLVDGIIVGAGCAVAACTVRDSGATGIRAGTGSTVSNCTVSASGTDGIRVISNAQVLGNTSTANGNIGAGAGILVEGTACRVDSNHVAGNDYGIRTLAGECLIVRNTARANAAGNFSFVVPTESAQVITNPGAAFIATNPWANFAY